MPGVEERLRRKGLQVSAGETRLVDVTFTVPTDAQDAGDVIAATQVVANALRAPDANGLLVSLILIDPDDQKLPLDVWLLSADVAVGTEDAAPSISDANAAFVLGRVAVLASDYKDLGGVSVAHPQFDAFVLKPATDSGALYAALVLGGTGGTWAGGAIIARFGILSD